MSDEPASRANTQWKGDRNVTSVTFPTVLVLRALADVLEANEPLMSLEPLSDTSNHQIFNALIKQVHQLSLNEKWERPNIRDVFGPFGLRIYNDKVAQQFPEQQLGDETQRVSENFKPAVSIPKTPSRPPGIKEKVPEEKRPQIVCKQPEVGVHHDKRSPRGSRYRELSQAPTQARLQAQAQAQVQQKACNILLASQEKGRQQAARRDKTHELWRERTMQSKQDALEIQKTQEAELRRQKFEMDSKAQRDLKMMSDDRAKFKEGFNNQWNALFEQDRAAKADDLARIQRRNKEAEARSRERIIEQNRKKEESQSKVSDQAKQGAKVEPHRPVAVHPGSSPGNGYGTAKSRLEAMALEVKQARDVLVAQLRKLQDPNYYLVSIEEQKAQGKAFGEAKAKLNALEQAHREARSESEEEAIVWKQCAKADAKCHQRSAREKEHQFALYGSGLCTARPAISEDPEAGLPLTARIEAKAKAEVDTSMKDQTAAWQVPHEAVFTGYKRAVQMVENEQKTKREVARARSQHDAAVKPKAETEAKAGVDRKEEEAKAKAEAETAKKLAGTSIVAHSEATVHSWVERNKEMKAARQSAENHYDVRIKANAEAEAKKMADARAKVEAESKAEREAKLKATAEARAKAEGDAKAKVEADKVAADLAAFVAEIKAKKEAKEAKEKARLESERAAAAHLQASLEKVEADKQAKKQLESTARLNFELNPTTRNEMAWLRIKAMNPATAKDMADREARIQADREASQKAHEAAFVKGQEQAKAARQIAAEEKDKEAADKARLLDTAKAKSDDMVKSRVPGATTDKESQTENQEQAKVAFASVVNPATIATDKSKTLRRPPVTDHEHDSAIERVLTEMDKYAAKQNKILNEAEKEHERQREQAREAEEEEAEKEAAQQREQAKRDEAEVVAEAERQSEQIFLRDERADWDRQAKAAEAEREQFMKELKAERIKEVRRVDEARKADEATKAAGLKMAMEVQKSVAARRMLEERQKEFLRNKLAPKVIVTKAVDEAPEKNPGIHEPVPQKPKDTEGKPLEIIAEEVKDSQPVVPKQNTPPKAPAPVMPLNHGKGAKLPPAQDKQAEVLPNEAREEKLDTEDWEILDEPTDQPRAVRTSFRAPDGQGRQARSGNFFFKFAYPK